MAVRERSSLPSRDTAPGPTTLPASDDALEGAEGVEGNARLTAANGILLTVLLAVEGLTILQVRSLITIHIFVGMILVTPITLKVVTTAYRFARYYLHGEAYVRRGPPHPFMRVLAPLLVAATVAMMATGIALLTRKPDSAGFLLTAHKASFIVWVALMTLHFLGHIAESLLLTAHDWKPKSAVRRPRGAATRRWVLVLTLIAGVGLAAAVTPGNNWSGHTPQGDQQGSR